MRLWRSKASKEPDVEEGELESAMIVACTTGNLRAIRALLLQRNDLASIELERPTGNTALHFAAIADRKEAILLLVELGAKLDKENSKGQTAASLCPTPIPASDIRTALVQRSTRISLLQSRAGRRRVREHTRKSLQEKEGPASSHGDPSDSADEIQEDHPKEEYMEPAELEEFILTARTERSALRSARRPVSVRVKESPTALLTTREYLSGGMASVRRVMWGSNQDGSAKTVTWKRCLLDVRTLVLILLLLNIFLLYATAHSANGGGFQPQPSGDPSTGGSGGSGGQSEPPGETNTGGEGAGGEGGGGGREGVVATLLGWLQSPLTQGGILLLTLFLIAVIFGYVLARRRGALELPYSNLEDEQLSQPRSILRKPKPPPLLAGLKFKSSSSNSSSGSGPNNLNPRPAKNGRLHSKSSPNFAKNRRSHGTPPRRSHGTPPRMPPHSPPAQRVPLPPTSAEARSANARIITRTSKKVPEIKLDKRLLPR